MAQTLIDAGCKFVGIGFESGSQKIIDALNKKTTIKKMYRACRILEECQIAYTGSFIYGLPEQTEEDLASNIEFFDNTLIYDSAALQFLPLPGAPLYRQLLSQRRINPSDPEYWEKVKYFSKPVEDHLK